MDTTRGGKIRSTLPRCRQGRTVGCVFFTLVTWPSWLSELSTGYLVLHHGRQIHCGIMMRYCQRRQYLGEKFDQPYLCSHVVLGVEKKTQQCAQRRTVGGGIFTLTAWPAGGCPNYLLDTSSHHERQIH